MTIHSVSSVSHTQTASVAQEHKTQTAPEHKSNPPQDTVQLSEAARAAAHDADHDGDSH